tara:strand:- start:32744 stop:33331 length:588 start_codon:yes stop_codon:yes gene_type:complete
MEMQLIKELVQNSIDIKSAILEDEELLQKISTLASKCIKALRIGGKIIFCGNGGSFADSQHLSAEFTSRFKFDRPGLSSLALGTNSSTMTAIGNDYGYENIFAREINAIGTSSDILIAITTSGNSNNILKAIEAAEKADISAFVMTGSKRGKIPENIDTLFVPSDNTARIQECHILIGHIICEIVESEIFEDLKL